MTVLVLAASFNCYAQTCTCWHQNAPQHPAVVPYQGPSMSTEEQSVQALHYCKNAEMSEPLSKAEYTYEAAESLTSDTFLIVSLVSALWNDNCSHHAALRNIAMV